VLKSIIHTKKLKKFVILHKRLVFNFATVSFFYQNDVLLDYSIKISEFLPILGLGVDAFRAA
jgi:hypothetical protein